MARDEFLCLTAIWPQPVDAASASDLAWAPSPASPGNRIAGVSTISAGRRIHRTGMAHRLALLGRGRCRGTISSIRY